MKNRVLLAFMYNTSNFLSNAKQNIHIHYEAHSLHILTILYYMYKHTVLELFYAFIKLSYQILPLYHIFFFASTNASLFYTVFLSYKKIQNE